MAKKKTPKPDAEPVKITPRTFQKRKLEIQAIQWTGDNAAEILIWIQNSGHPAYQDGNALIIPTLEGDHEASLNDFVIRGIQGEFYPCKPDIFTDSYDEVLDEVQTVFDNPEAFDPLTEDMDLWAAFRAQRAVARAFANDQDAACFALEQCQAMVLLIAKSPKCMALALLKHLELLDIKTDLEEPHALFLAEVFRSTFLEGRMYRTRLAALAAPQGPHAPPKIPIEESSLELVDEPLALTETAKRS